MYYSIWHFWNWLEFRLYIIIAAQVKEKANCLGELENALKQVNVSKFNILFFTAEEHSSLWIYIP